MFFLDLLQKLQNNSASRTELNQLIKHCAKIALIYIKRSNQKFNCAAFDDISVKDIALDAIVPLFLNNKKSQYAITEAFINWDNPIISEQDVQIFIHMLVLRRTEQHISTLLKESDPLFGKILKSLNYYIHSLGYIKRSYFGMIYICESDSELIHNKVLDCDSFHQIPGSIFREGTDKLLVSLFSYLKEQTDFYPAIPLNILAKKLKDLVQLQTQDFFSQYENKLDMLELEETVQNGLTAAADLLVNNYARKSKLTSEEIELLKFTLQDMSVDLNDGGINRGLYDYLKNHMPELEKEEYYNRYHNVLDYLVRIMKKNIAENLLNSK